MRYKPERALTLGLKPRVCKAARRVEMRYKPERALTRELTQLALVAVIHSRNEV